MKAVICGAGQVGSNIARALARERIDVTVIDTSEELCRKISDTLEVQAITGFASHPHVLERAGTADADLLIAVTHSDEVNMVACEVAGAIFNVPKKIARVRSQSYLSPMYGDLFGRDHMNIDLIISPEIEVAQMINRDLRTPGAFDVVPLANGALQGIGVHCNADCPVVNTPLRQLTDLFPDLHILIVAIIRDGKPAIPNPEDQLQAGDDVYFVVEPERVKRALAAFGHEEREARRLVIIGGGNIGLFLTSQIEREFQHANIKLIEFNAERAKLVASSLQRTVVINGDGLDADIMDEAGVRLADTVVAVTNDDETNILASLLAKRAGAANTMALVNKMAYEPLASSLGIDTFISPRATTVSSILEHVRKGRIHAVHALRSEVGELIEGEVLQTSGMAGKALRDIEMPEGSMVGALLRGGKPIMPRGDTEVKLGDHVVVMALSESVKKVERLFAVRLEYF